MTLSVQKQLLIIRFLATRWWDQLGDLIAANSDDHFEFDDLDFDLELKEIRRGVSLDDLDAFSRLALNSELDEKVVAGMTDFGDMGAVDAFAEVFAVNLVGVLAQPDTVADFLPVLWDPRFATARPKICQFLARSYGTAGLKKLANDRLEASQSEELVQHLSEITFLQTDGFMIHYEGERDRLERAVGHALRQLGLEGNRKPDEFDFEYLSIKRIGAWVSVMLPPYVLATDHEFDLFDVNKLCEKLSESKNLARIVTIYHQDGWHFSDWRNGRLYDTNKKGHWKSGSNGAENIAEHCQRVRIKIYDAGHPRALQKLDFGSTATAATKQGAVRRFCLVKQRNQ